MKHLCSFKLPSNLLEWKQKYEKICQCLNIFVFAEGARQLRSSFRSPDHARVLVDFKNIHSDKIALAEKLLRSDS